MSDSPLDVAISVLIGDLDSSAAEARRLLFAHQNVILYGPPGTGKSRAAQMVADSWVAGFGAEHVIHTTFHPSYSYEDFVEGFRPKSDDPSSFELTSGVLLRAASKARDKPTLLVIDEINRADVAKVFGELITYIEPDKRDRAFTTTQGGDKEYAIPSDLYFLGTMNTADKSISLLDVALRRRFKFVECPPLPAAFAASSDWKRSAFGIDLGKLLTAINDRLLDVGVSRDRLIGQALLGIPSEGDDAELFDRIRYDVYPLVEEYLFGDAERMERVLPGLVAANGGLLRTGLTPENIGSWLPPVSDNDMDEIPTDAEGLGRPGSAETPESD